MRSLVVVIAVSIGLVAGVFSSFFMKGWINQRLADVINTEMAHIQVHKPKFKENYELNYLITNTSEKVSEINKIEGVLAASNRIIINSMVATAETGTGVKIVGTVPEQEKQVSNIHEKIIEGKYFEGVTRNPVVIGKKLADKLDVRIRNKIIITVQDINGDVISGAFRVAGIYKTSNTAYDGMTIFVRNSDISRLCSLEENTCHELAILLENSNNLESITDEISKLMPELKTENWRTLSPEMGYMDELMGVYMYMVVVIILLALCFGIINTMLMVVLERVKELGMLMAVGMNKLRVFSMIILESIFLSFTGGIIGIIFGYLISLYFSKVGLDLSVWGEGLSAMGFSPIIYPVIDFETLIITSALVILTGIISALYPAFKALRLNPAESIRTE
jgi:ABC-type lipoprotein release transport system permease subunit